MLGPCGSGTVDPAFTGVWKGKGTLNATPKKPYVYDAQISITASQDLATIVGTCANGDGTINLKGGGRRLMFGDSFTCSPAFIHECRGNTFTFKAITYELVDDMQLSVKGSGTSECGSAPVPFTFELIAKK